MPCLKQKICLEVPKRIGAPISLLLLIAIIVIAPVSIGTRTSVYKLDTDRLKIGMRRRVFSCEALAELFLGERHVSLCPPLLSMKITSNFVFRHQRRKLPPYLVQTGL